MKKLLAAASAVAILGAATAAHAARDYVWAAGSSTVFPFTSRVAEQFARKSGNKAPKVESLGTGGGFKLFCQGVGEGTSDIANASRPMKQSEFDTCQKNGVKDIVEIKIGFDGIVIANAKSAPAYNFDLGHIYLGLADQALRGGEFVKNPYKTWKEIGSAMPAQRILVYGPPPTSGTRDAFLELGMQAGAKKFPTLKELASSDEKKFQQISDRLRTDGSWVDAGENDNAIVQTLVKTPGALGVFGYSFLENNADKIKAASVNGVAPNPTTIANGSYPLARSLYIYVKKAHVGVTPGLRELLQEYMSDAATGRGGYLQDRGLIALPTNQRATAKGNVSGLTPMSRP